MHAGGSPGEGALDDKLWVTAAGWPGVGKQAPLTAVWLTW
jgi:hypothetical protein